MNLAQKQLGWTFWVWWVVLTAIGGLAGSYVADLLGLGMLNRPTDAGILFSMLGSGVFALAVSAAQWLLLRRLFSGSAWWMVAGTLGRAFGMLIGSIILVIIGNQYNLQAGFWSTGIYLVARGAVLGTSQWLLIRQWRTRAAWWIPANALAWMLGSALLELFIPPALISQPIFGDIIEVVVAGAITGAVMLWLFRQPAPVVTRETKGRKSIIAWILVWTISWGLSWAAGWSLVRDIIGSGYISTSGLIGGEVAGGIAAVIGGVGTAIVLKLARPSVGFKIVHLALMALGWAGIVYYDWLGGFAVAGLSGNQNKYGVVIPALSAHQIQHGVSGPLSGLVGGAVTALILIWLVRSLNWKQLSIIVTAWALGFAIAGWVVWTIAFPIALNYVYGPIYSNDPGLSSLVLSTLISALFGGLAGWIGAAATLKQL